jgi:membrane protein implicated in regulation of membrane protease activity
MANNDSYSAIDNELPNHKELFVFIAIVILLLALIGVLPPQFGLPLALGSLVVGGVGFYSMQRRVSLTPVENGQEAMLGSIAGAITNIERDGQIRYGNEIWNARTMDGAIAQGEFVRIVSFDGLRALVVPESSHADG